MNHSESRLRTNPRIVPPDLLLKFGYSPSGGIEFDSAAQTLSFYQGGTKRVDLTSFGLAVRNGEGLVVGHTAQITVPATSELQVLGTSGADSSMILGRWSDDTVPPDLFFVKSRGTSINSNGIVQDGDDLGRITFWGNDGGDSNTPGARITAEVDGTPGVNDMPGRLVFSTTPDGSTSLKARMRLDSAGGVFINDTSNANMTVGLTINQGANDNEILTLKSSDVAQPVTAVAEADTYGTFKKAEAASGGLIIQGFKDSDGVAGRALQLFGTLGETADTTDTSTSTGVVQISGRKTDGGTSIAALGDTENVLIIANSGTVRWLIKGNGDVHQTTDAHTTLDSWDDVDLLRAYSQVTAPDAIIRNEWDRFVDYNEQDLIAAGVLGKAGKHGLTNTSQLMRLHTGAIWQQHTKHMSLVERVDNLTIELTEAKRHLAALEA